MNNSFAEPEFVNLTKDMCEKIRDISTRRNISFADFIREAIQKRLDECSGRPFIGLGDY